MGIVTRYFSSSGAGAADGTTWANRAPLFSAGNWSSIITGHNFAADALVCLVEGGVSYSPTQALATGLFTTAPTFSDSLHFHACDSSGVVIDPPDGGWSSAEAPFSTATLPTLSYTTDINVSSMANVSWRCIYFTHSARTSAACFSDGNFDFCGFQSSSNSTSHSMFSGSIQSVSNSFVRMTGTGFSQISVPASLAFYNVRFDGGTATSGTRAGIVAGTTGAVISRCTVLNCPGGGILTAAGAATRHSQLFCNTIVNCGTYGIRCNATASQTVYHNLRCNMIVNCVIGIDGNTNARVLASGNRLRDNSTADFSNMADNPTTFNTTAAGTNADEFVNAGAGDFRIKTTSTYWNKGIGAGDQENAGGSTTIALHPLTFTGSKC